MRKIVLFLSLVISLYGCQKVDEPNDNQKNVRQLKLSDWHNRSQNERNQAIILRAYQDNGNYVAQNCKQWANTVVLSASESCMSLPTTAAPPNDWYWNANQFVEGRSGLIEYAKPGEIVQMKLTSGGPHTAIIYNLTSTHVTFIESNWCTPPCNIVNTRTLTFSTFYGQVSNYTIYRIL